MSKNNKKQQASKAEIIDFDLEKKSPKYCDHQWCFVSRNESKDIVDWKCNYCNDVGITRGPLPKGNLEGKFVGF
jgi:hypothetical protein